MIAAVGAKVTAVRPRRILVVDDDELLREVATTALELVGGWEVVTAPSGSAAEERAAALVPDAILLDVMMPEVDGPMTLAALRANPATRDIPVVFLTAKAATDDPRWSGLGLTGVLAKPFDPMRLADDLSAMLGWTRGEHR